MTIGASLYVGYLLNRLNMGLDRYIHKGNDEKTKEFLILGKELCDTINHAMEFYQNPNKEYGSEFYKKMNFERVMDVYQAIKNIAGTGVDVVKLYSDIPIIQTFITDTIENKKQYSEKEVSQIRGSLNKISISF